MSISGFPFRGRAAAPIVILCGLQLLAIACASSGRPDADSWPFIGWDRAEVVLFNHTDMAPGIPLMAWTPNGWSQHVVERRSIDRSIGERAVALVEEVQGDARVSSCPFPRHAIVLFDGDRPVASANFCVSCGDLLIYPGYPVRGCEGTPRECERERLFGGRRVDGLPEWLSRYSESDWIKLFEDAGVAVDPWPR